MSAWSVLAQVVLVLAMPVFTGEMEVLLTGRAGLDKDFCVRFLYRIAIW